jgi:hypothetical protein
MTSGPSGGTDPNESRAGDTSSGETDSSESATDGSTQGAFGQSLAAAAKRSGLGSIAEGETPNGKALLAAMGGIRGLAETILPGLVFLVLYTFTKNVPLSLGASVGVAVVFTIVRLATRTPVTQSVAGLIGVGGSAILALLTDKPENNFVPGFFIDGAYALALLISIVVGWPLIGLLVGYLVGNGTAWRSDRRTLRVMQLLTLCWVGLFVVRLIVQLPLYFAGNVEWLAVTRLLMGVPLYATLILMSWLLARSVFDLKPARRED